MESEKTVCGKCPICGADVVKTLKGWACADSLLSEPKCQFFLFSTVGNRKLSDSEASILLSEKRILLDGFATREGKCFSSILSFNQDGSVNMSSQIGNCPKCGGILYTGPKSVSCGNFKRQENPCNFTIWRNIGGHDLLLSQIEEIIHNGATSEAVTMYDSRGCKSDHRIGLNAEKEVVRL